MLRTIVAGGFLLAGSATAQTATVVYDLVNVWLLPNVSHPGQAAQQMTGSFEWTYATGDFENGSGQFLEASIPWYGTDIGSLDINVEPGSIEFVLPGSYHDLGLDLTLFLLPRLAASQRSLIDTTRSSFDIQQGISHKGQVISGRIVPRPSAGTLPPGTSSPPRNYGAGSVGSGGFLPSIRNSGGDPRIGNGSFQIDCDQLPGGAECYLLIGSDRDRFQVAGTSILVDPSTALVIPVRATGTTGVAGDGSLRIPIPIPDDPRAVGLEVHFQVVALDTDSPRGLVAATDGLTIVVQAGP